MLIKSRAGWKRLMLLVCLTSAVVLIGMIPVRVSYFDAAIAAHAATTDRISFYNVPADHKLESHLDYANGQSEKIQYPAVLCAAGTVITQSLNLYTATFVAEGCGTTVFQNLNLRWLGGCQFEFEHDPEARLVARGPYGETVIGEGHYPAGALQLANLPANTTSLTATMTYTNPQGTVQTGNVAFAFHEPQPACGQALTSTPTRTPTATPTGSLATLTPTATSTPTASATATPTTTATAAIVTPTVNAEPATATATMPASDIPPVGAASTATPTPTSTPTATETAGVLPPTGLDPIGEPEAPSTAQVYLPLVVK